MINYSLLKYPHLLLSMAAAVVLLSACGFPASHTADAQLTVFAASSLSDAFDALAVRFEEDHPNVEVVRHYASSSQLAAQLIEGARADLYASANELQMENVVAAGLVSGSPVNFVTNRLTVITPADNPVGISSPFDLGKPGISLVLSAPDTPIRVYSDQVIAMLGDADFQTAVYANLVSEEANVRQVAAKIALGEADAGIVYISDITPDVAVDILQIEIPDEFNLTAVYPIAVVESSRNPELAEQFLIFILSPTGQAILTDWGFGPVP
jgi:molybdate transport system substrate-binding protein